MFEMIIQKEKYLSNLNTTIPKQRFGAHILKYIEEDYFLLVEFEKKKFYIEFLGMNLID